MDIKIEVPQIKEQKRINELARQIQKIHFNWRPDLFLNVEEVISKERLKGLLDKKSIYVAKIGEEIVGYIIIDIMEKDNSFIRYRKLLVVDTLCVE